MSTDCGMQSKSKPRRMRWIGEGGVKGGMSGEPMTKCRFAESFPGHWHRLTV